MRDKFVSETDQAMLAPPHKHIVSPLFRLQFEQKMVAFYEDLPFAKSLAESVKDRTFYQNMKY